MSFPRFILGLLFAVHGACAAAGPVAKPLRILPLGDSITRGSYLAQHADGPYQGKAIGRANPKGGGWRKLLQDHLRAAGVPCDFVGELSYHAYGEAGTVDPAFDPDHHGLAGFGNRQILEGGTVPTPADVLAALGITRITVPDLATVLQRHQPDIILLMSGANGFDAPARDELIRHIGRHSSAHLFVATILPQRPPRAGWAQVDEYNASLPAIVSAQQAAGHRVTMVEMNQAVGAADLLPDGVHPGPEGLRMMAAAWFGALRTAGYVPSDVR
jgi:lysophospholipase L1-like esterase